MTGRRKMRLSAGEFRPVNNPSYPVIKRGHWTEVPYEENIKKIEVSKLKVFSKILNKLHTAIFILCDYCFLFFKEIC